MRNRNIVFSALVSLTAYVFALSGGNFELLVVVQSLFPLWVLYNFIFKSKEMLFSAYGITAWWILSMVLAVNLWVNSDNYSVTTTSFQFAAFHIIGIIFLSLGAQWAGSNLEPDTIFELLSYMLLPLAIFGIFLSWGTPGRAAPLGIHPNWWGELAFGLSLFALAVKKGQFRIFFVIIALILMYLVQSRGALLSSLLSVFAYWILRFRPFSKTSQKAFTISIFSVAGILFLVFMMDWLSPIISFLEDRVLMVYDPYRGLYTGFTGRIYTWKEALSLFLEEPIWGHGFDTLTEIHNGFLRFAAEGGIILFGTIVLMIAHAMVTAWRQRNDLVFATLLGILAYFMSYPRALNLNVVGVAFILCLFPRDYHRTKLFKEN